MLDYRLIAAIMIACMAALPMLLIVYCIIEYGRRNGIVDTKYSGESDHDDRHER